MVQYRWTGGTVRVVRGTGYGTGDTAVGYGWCGGTVRAAHLVHVVSCCVNLYKIWVARSYNRSGPFIPLILDACSQRNF